MSEPPSASPRKVPIGGAVKKFNPPAGPNGMGFKKVGAKVPAGPLKGPAKVGGLKQPMNRPSIQTPSVPNGINNNTNSNDESVAGNDIPADSTNNMDNLNTNDSTANSFTSTTETSSFIPVGSPNTSNIVAGSPNTSSMPVGSPNSSSTHVGSPNSSHPVLSSSISFSTPSTNSFNSGSPEGSLNEPYVQKSFRSTVNVDLASLRKINTPLTPTPSGQPNTNPDDYPSPANASKRLDEAFNNPLFGKVEISFSSRRDNAAYELLTTEQSYCKSLTIMNELYRLPLLEACKRGILPVPEELINDIFSRYFTDITRVNFVLLQGLVERFHDWGDHQFLGDLLLDLLPFLKMYTQYTSNYEKAIASLEILEQGKEVTTKFLEELNQNPHRGVDLRAYLIMPIQRIPRYRLLLEEIVKNTPPEHPDRKDLDRALENIKVVAIQIDAAIVEHKNRAKLLEIQDAFFGEKVQIIEAGRTFIKEGELEKVCRKDVQKRSFWLFNDMFLYAKQLPSSSRFSKHRKFALTSLGVKDIPDDGKMYKNAIQIATEKKSFVVLASSPEEKASWMSEFTKALDKLDESSKTLRNENRQRHIAAVAPVWVPDSEATTCTICGLKFTLFERRHHCRQCGHVVCSKCSSKKKELPGQGKKRVCDVCYKKPYPDGSAPVNPTTTTNITDSPSTILENLNNNPMVTGRSDSVIGSAQSTAQLNTQASTGVGQQSNSPPTPTISKPLTVEQYRAAYDYEAPQSKPKKLSFKVGDVLDITQKADSGWWLAVLGTEKGWVPASYLEPLV